MDYETFHEPFINVLCKHLTKKSKLPHFSRYELSCFVHFIYIFKKSVTITEVIRRIFHFASQMHIQYLHTFVGSQTTPIQKSVSSDCMEGMPDIETHTSSMSHSGALYQRSKDFKHIWETFPKSAQFPIQAWNFSS